MLLLLLPALARAQGPIGATAPEQGTGCAEMPVLTPATLTASDLRCFPMATPRKTLAPTQGRERTTLFPVVLGSVGAVALGVAIGFGVGGESLLGGSSTAPSGVVDSVRVDFAVANVAFAIGLTALVTAIVLALFHH